MASLEMLFPTSFLSIMPNIMPNYNSHSVSRFIAWTPKGFSFMGNVVFILETSSLSSAHLVEAGNH